MIFFTGKKVLKEIRAIRDEHDNLLHLIKVLAKEAGIIVEINKPGDGSAMIALVRQGDNHVHFHPINKEKTNG